MCIFFSAGIKLTMIHIPGETKDMIGVWLEKDKTFLCGDNLYKNFPNLYSIRGTPTRSTLAWASSTDVILDLKPNLLVPSHLMPIRGWADISSILTTYRDAIQYVHDQTLRHMNRGLLPDEISDVIELPPQLASHPYLQEIYGTVHWSVKGVFDAYMGWFSGDPVELSPLTPDARAVRLVDFGGGVDDTVKKAEDAAKSEDYQWALELSSSVLRVMPRNPRALTVKANALQKMSETQTSVNGIFYYKSCAAETLGEIDTKPSSNAIKVVMRQASMWHLFNTLRVYFKSEECQEKNISVWFKILNSDISFIRLHIRNGVVVVTEKKPKTNNFDVVCSEAQCRHFVIELMLGSEQITPISGFDSDLVKCFGQ